MTHSIMDQKRSVGMQVIYYNQQSTIYDSVKLGLNDVMDGEFGAWS